MSTRLWTPLSVWSLLVIVPLGEVSAELALEVKRIRNLLVVAGVSEGREARGVSDFARRLFSGVSTSCKFHAVSFVSMSEGRRLNGARPMLIAIT